MSQIGGKERERDYARFQDLRNKKTVKLFAIALQSSTAVSRGFLIDNELLNLSENLMFNAKL